MISERRTTPFTVAMTRGESRFALIIRRTVIAIAGIYVLFFSWNMYRRIWQVLRIEPRAASAVLQAGDMVGYDVITSGTVRNRIRLELIQGDRTELVHEQLSQFRTQAVFDVRLFRYTPTVTLTEELLSRFQPGPATLRVTGFGSQKLLRTPAPRVSELRVQLITAASARSPSRAR
jgi:hypothetical protein